MTDATGAEVTIPQQVARVVSIDPMMSHTILMPGCGDRLLGATFGPVTRMRVDAICRAVSGTPAPGSPKGSNIEEIVRLNPDRVVAWAYPAREAGQITGAGIPVIMIETEKTMTMEENQNAPR
jgi:ABC-type Fe3+-hydroxamate transport system substrate-binding protein